MEKIIVVPGIAMPFFPMRPQFGAPFSNKRVIKQFNDEVLNTYDWFVQPKLDGDRASIGVVDGKVYIQNRHGSWYKHRVNNLPDFKHLPNRTVLDGEVFKGNFYPFECLAVDGMSVVLHTPNEREVLAQAMVKLIGHTWKFPRPTLKWIERLSANAPEYDGVVMKRWGSPYIIAGSASTGNLDWKKRHWV